MDNYNAFIDYLNSMNNAGSDTINALAESQVTNKYYNKIRIKRPLGNYIAGQISSHQHAAYILTGHAGDGKTSILVQILKDLNLLGDGERLEKSKQYDQNGISLFYVKDMSEATEKEQTELLKQALEAPANKSSSVLISNTGPILKAFKTLIHKNIDSMGATLDEKINSEIEDVLLNQMDKNVDKKIELFGYKFYLINIARIDNVDFARQVIDKIISPELWESCENCSNKDICPYLSNIEHINKYHNRVTGFITYFYRWLYENDKRMTIRQMMSHLCYSLTGNKSCKQVTKTKKALKFRYNLANLFFGYIGSSSDSAAGQIKGINQMRLYTLDKRALKEDYALFVKKDYTNIPNDIVSILNEANLKDGLDSTRLAIRRFFLMYSHCESNEQMGSLINELYGEGFSQYVRCITDDNYDEYLDKIDDLVFDTIYYNNCGVLPHNVNDIYFTLRRNDDVYQNNMILLGKIGKDELEIKKEKLSSGFEHNKYIIVLNVGDDKFEFTYPLIAYFSSIVNGEIISNSNPVLTHGVDKLNAMLYMHNTSKKKSKNSVKILTNTMSEPKQTTLTIKDGKLRIKST